VKEALDIGTTLRSTKLTLISGATILEIAVEKEDSTTLDLSESFSTKCVFSHVQAELPQLRVLKSWDDQ